MANDTLRERLRHSYRPDNVRILFVGESPPAGDTFFYEANSVLFHHTQEAFTRAFDRSFASGKDFLDFFRSQGCYLEDLSLVALNRASVIKRRRHRTKGINSLAKRIRAASPATVIVVMRAIRAQVNQAVQQAGIAASIYFLPFPAFGHKQEYVKKLTNILREL